MESILQFPAAQTEGDQRPHYFTRLRMMKALVASFLLFWFCGPLIRHADPAAAAVDLGVLSLVILALLSLLLFITISLWLLGLLWPVFRDYQKYHFGKNFKSLSPAWKLLVYLGTFFLLLYAFVLCLMAVV